MSLKATIATVFQEVAREQRRTLAPLTDDLNLRKSGLDSFGVALTVVRLEDVLGFDPFDTDADVRFPTTFGEFVRLYESRPSG